MKDDKDQELEEYIRMHCHEPLRQIVAGIKKQYDVTKSTKYVTPRRKAALLAETLVEEVIEAPEAETPSEEEAEVEEPETEDDPKIIEMKRQLREVNKKRKRVDARTLLAKETLQLLLIKYRVKNVKELDDNISAYRPLLKRDKGHIVFLRRKLLEAMKLDPNYYPDAICSDCHGRFFSKVDDDLIMCCVCLEEREL